MPDVRPEPTKGSHVSAEVIYGIDFRSKSREHKVSDGQSFDFAVIESEIAASLGWPNNWPLNFLTTDTEPTSAS